VKWNVQRACSASHSSASGCLGVALSRTAWMTLRAGMADVVCSAQRPCRRGL
jgi:hypothetical protein